MSSACAVLLTIRFIVSSTVGPTNVYWLIACDLIVERSGRPLLLEVNANPGIGGGAEWLGKLYKRLVDDTVGLVLDLPDAAAPRLDGVHVQDFRESGYLPLLGGSSDPVWRTRQLESSGPGDERPLFARSGL